jgi:hypothetical protein
VNEMSRLFISENLDKDMILLRDLISNLCTFEQS